MTTPELTKEGPVTKRIISSACAKTFDILGWYSPALIQAKSLLQQLWIAGRAWDDPAPEDVADKFITWRKELKHIRLHAVPRKLTQNNLSPVMTMQLHGFADASETGYGAVVYARILHQDATITVTLVAAKARVAPKKSVTMPRLELLGSLMLSKLLPKIASILQVEEANTYYWIDSQIVLAWIQKDPQQLKTFVQNRVSAIQSATHKSRWNYVRRHQNPADHASRGLSPRQTVQNHLWWKGPPWLMSPPHLWPCSLEQNPISLQQQQHSALPELKVRKMTTATMDLPLWSKFSSMTKLARVLAYCLRFVHHKHRIRDPLLTHSPALSLEEADGAQVITPGHFLIGRHIRAHPQDIPPPKDGIRKVRWSLLRAESEQLWKRWHTAYVQSLQSRQKWTRLQPNISVGDIVLLKDDSLKLHSWPLAKVTDVSPGPDGVVRVVTLTLPGGRTFTRHVRHLVPRMRASDCSPCPGGGECPRSKGWIWRLPQQQP